MIDTPITNCEPGTVCFSRQRKARYLLVDWQAQHVRLSTTKGRLTIPFIVPDYALPLTGYPTSTADLIRRDGSWWLHVVVQLPASTVEPADEVVGVDLGLVQPAVTSTHAFLGQKRWRAVEGRYFKQRRALQKAGTKSAKRHLRRMRHRQARFRRDCDHLLSKQIVQAATPGSTIVLENLTDIRRRVKAKRQTEQKRRLHGWSFAQLKVFITYKAEAQGCTVAGVDPRHTSQRCSRCGHTARHNRRARALFVCQECGFTLHAYLNASRNIAAKYRARLGRPEPGAPLSIGVSWGRVAPLTSRRLKPTVVDTVVYGSAHRIALPL